MNPQQQPYGQQYPQQPYPAPYGQPPQPPKKSKAGWIALLVIAPFILCFIGVGAVVTGEKKSEGAPRTVATTTAASVVGEVVSAAEFTGPDKAFLATLTNARVKQEPQVDLVNLGRKICPRIEASGKPEALAILTRNGFTVVQATDVLYAAVVAYCPDQLVNVK